MLGIIVASIMLAFRVPLNSALLAFIGFQLLDISMNLSYFRVKDKKKDRAIASMFKGMAEAFGKEKDHAGRRGAEDCNSDREGNRE